MNEKFVSVTLRKLGIPASLSGFKYIMEGLKLIEENELYLFSVTKLLYPAIAKKYDTKASSVERNVRHAIETGFKYGDIDLLNEVFQYAYDSQKGKATNQEFFGNLIEWLRYEDESELQKSQA